MAIANTASNNLDNDSTQRYHDLDAFRAWAVLLGIVLHAVWLMLPFKANTPIVDSDYSPSAQWLFFFIHLFRMQAFFLVAGFFGNMVYQRRGLWGFTRHRFVRIVIPLVVGAALLVPWMLYYYTWGGLISGAELSSEPFFTLLSADFITIYSNDIPLWHLWFIYDLVLLYIATLMFKVTLDKWIDRRHAFRGWWASQFGNMMRSPANITLLTIPSALLLLPMKYWIGVEGYPTWLIPDWYGFLSYWMIFVIGWSLYSQRDLLPIFAIRWRYNLLVGLLISFPIWGLYENHIRPIVSVDYPLLFDSQIHDYASVRARLLSAREPSIDKAGSPVREIWNRLSPAWQQRIEQQEQLNVNHLAGFAAHLTKTVVLGDPLEKIPLELATIEDGPEKNRRALEVAFDGAIAGRLQYTPRVWTLKAAYSTAYGFAMWYLVFGFMGFFQHYFRNPSPCLRYVSDSAYWLYLLHLPIIFWLAMYLAPIKLGVLGKFAAYNILAVAILMPTYHYFVRSTWIGTLLNGRRYPFQPFFRSDLFRTTEQVQFEQTHDRL